MSAFQSSQALWVPIRTHPNTQLECQNQTSKIRSFSKHLPVKCATKRCRPHWTQRIFLAIVSGNHGWKPSNIEQRNRLPTCSDRKPLRKTLINLHAEKSNHHHPVLKILSKSERRKWGIVFWLLGFQPKLHKIEQTFKMKIYMPRISRPIFCTLQCFAS